MIWETRFQKFFIVLIVLPLRGESLYDEEYIFVTIFCNKFSKGKYWLS